MANKRLFLDDYLFYGEYEEMVRTLTSVFDNNSGAKIFNSGIELYMASAIVGAHFNLRSKPAPKTEKTFRIMANQFTQRGDELNLIFKLVMLNADKDINAPIDRINNAFKYSPDDPEYQNNILLFEECMLGGLREIYSNVMLSTNKRFDDYFNSLNTFISKFKGDQLTEEDEIDFGDVF